MAWVTGGLLNKQVAAEIGVTEITVKVHRGKVTRKMGAKSLADLVKMADLLGISPHKNLGKLYLGVISRPFPIVERYHQNRA